MKSLNPTMTGTGIPLLALFIILVIPRYTEARTLRVPESYPAIQQAINVAVNGDTVLVNDGFYQEQVNFLGKNIVVASRYILDHDSVHIYNTEINRAYLNEGVKIISGEGPGAQLTGFTISNCLWKAVYVKNASPSIRHNIIKGNKATGICLEVSAATISDNEIACYPGFDMGGPYSAIQLFNSGPVVERNLISCNDGAGNVHAIDFDLWNMILPGVQTDIRENQILGELFGGLPDNGLPQLIHHNVITSGNNFSSAMNITDCASNLEIFNNTVIGGGGIWIQGGNFPTIRNNIVAYANTGIELWADTAIVAYNNVWQCKTPYSGVEDQTGLHGNISADPGFRNRDNRDFHLVCSSPCIDAGDPLSEYSMEPVPNGGRINMGNYGNTPGADPSVACLSIFPGNIDFGYVPVNASRDTDVVILNAGHAGLTISGITTTNINTFSTSYPGGTTLLTPGKSTTLKVAFHPTTGKVHYTDSVIIASNAANPGRINLYGHTALGVEAVADMPEFELYPVPVTGTCLYIRPVHAVPGDLRVEIIRITGEVVYTAHLHPEGNFPVTIHTGRLENGIYWLKARSSTSCFTRKFSVSGN